MDGGPHGFLWHRSTPQKWSGKLFLFVYWGTEPLWGFRLGSGGSSMPSSFPASPGCQMDRFRPSEAEGVLS